MESTYFSPTNYASPTNMSGASPWNTQTTYGASPTNEGGYSPWNTQTTYGASPTNEGGYSPWNTQETGSVTNADPRGSPWVPPRGGGGGTLTPAQRREFQQLTQLSAQQTLTPTQRRALQALQQLAQRQVQRYTMQPGFYGTPAAVGPAVQGSAKSSLTIPLLIAGVIAAVALSRKGI